MASRSLHVSEWIDRPADDVYEFARVPANLGRWAGGLGDSVENVDGEWFLESPEGRIKVVFAERNSFGILDHEVTTPSGDVVLAPMRVIPDREGCEVVFTVRRLPGMSDEELTRDGRLVAADLATLKGILETGTSQP